MKNILALIVFIVLRDDGAAVKLNCVLPYSVLSLSIMIATCFWLVGCNPSSTLPEKLQQTKTPTEIPSGFDGFEVRGRHLYAPCGEKVLLRGVNRMIFFMERSGIPSYREIAKTGANSVRIMWMMAGTADELDITLTNARSAGLIPMIELHDGTVNWSMLPKLVDYWVRPDIVAVLQKHEEAILVNIGNEVGGNHVTAESFEAGYTTAVQRMRAAGLKMPLVIDAPGEGRDIDTLQSTFAALLQADPESNLLFSIHMWWAANRGYSAETVKSEIAESVALSMPLIIGEFAAQWIETDGGKIPYKTILAEAEQNEIGYLAWSWGGAGDKGNIKPFMDMTTNGTFDTLTGWGKEVAITSPYSIKNSSVRPCMDESSP